ncbi:MAG: hypothetical protein HY400_03000, partial [Elusimicrobia bacterium]|nr:hypothetical protein [Elusimicrobiota bacterium]
MERFNIMWRFSFLLSCLFFFILHPSSFILVSAASRDSTSNTVEAKLALESSLEKRLRSLLTEILGSEDLIVIINVDLRTEQEKREVSEEEVMPGVPVKQNPAVPGAGALGATLTMVKRVQATIIVDKATRDTDIKLIQKVTGGLLGVSPERGDAISIEKMEFRKTRPLTLQDFTTPDSIWKILWFFFLAAALVLVYSGFLTRFLGIGREIITSIRT